MKLLLLVLLMMSTQADAENYYSVKDPKRVVKLIGSVDGSQIKVAQEIDRLSSADQTPIFMLINSPGGSVVTGLIIVDAMRQAQHKGVKFHCASAVMAASMAFTILSECDTRATLANTRLLFHPMSFTGLSGRVQELSVLMVTAVKEELRLAAVVRTSLGVSKQFFNRHYFAETFWTAEALLLEIKNKKFLSVVPRIEGFGKDVFTYQRPEIRPSFFQTIDTDAERILNRYEKLTN